MDNPPRTSESGEDRDPHDLSLSPQHATRTSIVDNMLLSLDQFAPSSSVLDDYRLFNSAFETDHQSHYSQESYSHGRYRGHTFSSSMSSELDYGFEDATARYPTATAAQGQRSNSSSNHQTTPRQVGSSRGGTGTIPRSNTARQGSKGSSASAVDYTYTIPRARTDQGLDRRSASFDCGPKRAFAPSTSVPAGPFYDDHDAAPTPSVPAGPRKVQDCARTPVASRRNSMKSAQAPLIRKVQPENTNTNPQRDDFQTTDTAAIAGSLDPPAPSPTISYNKPAFPPPEPISITTIPTNPKERPGFFRRVFGSKTSAPLPADTTSVYDVSQEHKTTTSLNATKTPAVASPSSARTGPHQVVNKKSSFFRRRKRSVPDHAPPPIVIPQHLAPQTMDALPAPSPVSSLRQLMNPYLDEENLDGEANRQSEFLQAQKEVSSRTIPLAPTSSAEKDFSGSEISTDSAMQEMSQSVAASLTLSPVVEDFSRSITSHADAPQINISKSPVDPVSPMDAISPVDSISTASHYHTAVNTPLIEQEEPDPAQDNEPGDAIEYGPTALDREQAQKLFDSQDQVVGNEPAAAWLGDPDRAMVREAYMQLFNWSNLNIVASLRALCDRLVLKGETQQVDRVLDAFSSRWCDCNPSHGFKATDVVHTICYSILLLNTDLHLADIDSKMTKSQFVRNTMPTIHRVAMDAAPEGFQTLQKLNPVEGLDHEHGGLHDAGPLVNTPFTGTVRAWEQQVEAVLKEFYTSIQKEKLPLFGAQPEREIHRMSSHNFLGPSSGTLRRSPSTISKSGSDIFPRGRSANSNHGAARWSSKPRSRAGRLYPPSMMGSSRTSLDDQSSVWSPTGSSTWSKYSLGKFTSASVDSFGSDFPRGEYQQSIGFANALSQAIIREDSAASVYSFEEPERTTPLLEDDTLALAGAPWAKEGSLKHKHHLDAVDKRAKDRNWNDCFAVIQQGWMRLFSFNSPTKSMRQKTRQPGGIVVGGGNWTENAEELWKFMLRQTIASALPSPGYSKSRPYVWALSLPTGAVHLFQVGTSEIVREFVSTANYWSARLSKEPLIGGISNIEYGWSDGVINSALIGDENRSPPPSSGARASMQSSIRSSMDQQGVRPRLPADRVTISDWSPPQQSMVASNLTEEEQLKALQAYVKNVEDDLTRHNELRAAMNLAFSPRHPNAAKSMVNWERKSAYLLREIVKFRTYIDSLRNAINSKEKIFASNINNSQENEEPAVS
ncbi:SEC7-like alpha orthogonal bundle [Penicillium paradoxum]|uniref:SEC7-like alpha orthogonal bundle n=1 Tax=Penicillium paradoxum TaxID=176176 RepID=UPI002546C7FB|nr:SEC7-like alpha orthogonal bundle [Penicillium paradoxum]KAJ5780916.1 SEC7-like alpha orthogonal bundle [Penicillium paradoxum]